VLALNVASISKTLILR